MTDINGNITVVICKTLENSYIYSSYIYKLLYLQNIFAHFGLLLSADTVSCIEAVQSSQGTPVITGWLWQMECLRIWFGLEDGGGGKFINFQDLRRMRTSLPISAGRGRDGLQFIKAMLSHQFPQSKNSQLKVCQTDVSWQELVFCIQEQKRHRRLAHPWTIISAEDQGEPTFVLSSAASRSAFWTGKGRWGQSKRGSVEERIVVGYSVFRRCKEYNSITRKGRSIATSGSRKSWASHIAAQLCRNKAKINLKFTWMKTHEPLQITEERLIWWESKWVCQSNKLNVRINSHVL